ncbi:HEPN domain-containing protein [Candidatus Methanodesulfokora washburnensis]|jgi:HEPN domain-containing protein|nr:HEPN domain-containing protein [Candidatus Methanodesulfokores washburnensis]
MYREKFPTPSEWREIAIRDCYEAIRNYNTWITLMKVQNGEIYREEFCEKYCPMFPCNKCPKKGTEECDYCDASCEIGSGSTTCLLRVPQPYSSDVCFHAQQCYEKLLKFLISVSGRIPPKEHDLEKLLGLLLEIQDMSYRVIDRDIIECIDYLNLRNYNIARYCFKLPYEEVFRCRECAEKVLLKFSQETDLRR